MTPVHAATPAIAFLDAEHLLIRAPLSQVALKVKQTTTDHPHAQILVFDAMHSHVIDLDLRGSDAEILARLPVDASAHLNVEAAEPLGFIADEAMVRGRGRPKLGVVPREVTLLPRHWEWLNQQSGGASVTLRKLVEAARRQSESQQNERLAKESAYRFMAGLAGNQPNYEEASRALFAGDRARFSAQIIDWPSDVARHLIALAQPAFDASQKQS